MSGGTLALGAGGSILNSPTVNVGLDGTLLIDSSSNGITTTARTNDINLGGSGAMILRGNSANNTTDTFGNLTVAGFAAESLLTVTPGSGRTSTLQFLSLSRTAPSNSTGAGSTINFVGPNFGQAAGANVARVSFTTAPALQNSGASATQIIPWAVVTDTATGLSSIATYDSVLGSIRGLSTSVAADYQITGGGGSPVTAGNLLVNGATTNLVTGASTAGSLTLQGNGSTLSGVSGTTVKIGNGNTLDPLVSQGTGNVIGGLDSLSFGGAAANVALIWVSGDLTINSPIINAGTSTGITKSGPGNLILNSTGNTFTTTTSANHAGTIKILDGTVTFSAASNLGSSANFIDIWHGTLHLAGNTNSTVVVAQPITIGLGSITNDAANVMIDVDSGMTLSTGTLALSESTHIPEGFTKVGLGTLLLTAIEASVNNTGQSYLANGAFALGTTSGVGANLGNNGAVFIASPGTTIKYDSSALGTAATSRQGNLTIAAGNLNVIGNNTGGTSDKAGSVNYLTGGSSVSVTPGISGGTGQTSTLTLASITRNAGATLTFSGVNLGKATTAGTQVSQILISTAPTLTGTGSLGTTTAKILPYAIAVDSALGTTFATYDVTTAGFNQGIRVLTSAEMTTANATPAAGVNWLVSSAGSSTGPLSINTITLSANSAAVTNTGTLTVASGGILSKGTGTTIGGGTVAFAAVEGIVHVLAGDDLTITSTLTGTAGLTKADGGNLTLGTDNSAGLTGTVWINGGNLNVSADNNLGNAANAIVLNMGGTLNATTGFGSSRNMQVNPGGSTGISVASSQILTLAGNITNTLPTNLSPSTALGTLAVSGGGTLRLNGTVAPTITIANNTTLGGGGTLSAVIASAGSHLAPGNSIGHLQPRL